MFKQPATAAGLAHLAGSVAAGAITATQLVTLSLQRIFKDNPALNAVIAVDAINALAQAHVIDEMVVSGTQVGPLAGIPFLVKDLEDATGMATTKGSLTLADSAPASSDGLITARLKNAGAIAVGKTNLPEFAVEGFTANKLFGITRNPWAPDWSPGGSSGGSAAALAAGFAPIATATDGGGSIRIPAAFCGLVGLKPTQGLVGRNPIPDWIDLSTDGPIANSVADLQLLLSVMAGPTAGDPNSFAMKLSGCPSSPSHLLTITRTSNYGPLPADVAHAFASASSNFAKLVGLQPQSLTPSELFESGSPDEDWFVIAATEHVSSLGRKWVNDHFDQLHQSTQGFLAAGLDIGIDEYLAARRRRFDYVKRVDELLGGAGLFLSPTVAISGIPAVGWVDATGRLAATGPEIYSTMLQNLTGHPAITLPAGRCPNGVPFGLQVTGPRLSDNWLLEIAARWEVAHPWPLTAPGYDPFALR
ncbi:MAG: amidase [Actinobacteria bacterium]|nr:amidase [Actinomycetota bacterium]